MTTAPDQATESAPRKQLRVLAVTPDFPPDQGGIQHLVARLTENFTRSRVDVVTLRSANGSSPSSRRGAVGRNGVHVLRVPRLRLGPRRLGIVALNVVAVLHGLRVRPDVVLVAHIVAVPAARLIKRLTGARYVLYMHCDEIVHKPGLAVGGGRDAGAIVAVSSHTRDEARRIGVPGDAIVVIPPGVDVPARSAPTTSAPIQARKRPTVVTVARLEDRYKGHDVMTEAIAAVKRTVPDVLWAVVGDGALRAELEAAVARHGLAGNVVFTGAISDSERDMWLCRADVFAMPSRVPEVGGGEGFGIVFMEAAAHGLPVVAGAEGGAVDAVRDGETGLLVDPRSAGAVADAIVRLLTDEALNERLRTASRLHAREHGWPLIGRRVEDLMIRTAHAPGVV